MARGRGGGARGRGEGVSGKRARDRAPARRPAGGPALPREGARGAGGFGQGQGPPRHAADGVGELPDPPTRGRGRGPGALRQELRAVDRAQRGGAVMSGFTEREVEYLRERLLERMATVSASGR